MVAGSTAQPPEDPVETSQRVWWLSPPAALIGLLVVVVALILAAYSLARDRIQNGIEHTLGSVAQIKTEQIANWLDERRIETQSAVASPAVAAGLRDWLASERNPEAAGRAQARIAQALATARVSRFCLRSGVDGRAMLGSGCDVDTQELGRQAVAVASDDQPRLVDFHSATPSSVGVGMLLPIAWADDKPPVVIFLAFDPSKSLFPRLQRWPGGSPSAEILLVRRDHDQAQFLNTLRFRSDPPLAYRQPLSDGALLASQAINGKVGFVRGHDYRGIDSVGYVMPVPGTPWYLVAKMDQSEAEAWLDRLSIVVVVALALVMLAGSWWWKVRQRYVTSLHERDVAEAVLRERMDDLTRQTHDCIMLIELNGRVVDTNGQCESIYGDNRQEMLNRDGRQLLAAAQPDGDLAALWARLSAEGNLLLDTEHRRKDGVPVVAEISLRAFATAGVRCIQAIVRDITERKRAEERIEDLYQNAPCGYHSIDADGRFRLINNTELAWLGYRREEIIGCKAITDLLTPDSRERFTRTFPTMRRLGFVHDLELDFIRRDGSILPTLINATAIYAADGSFVMTRSMMLNMSERKAMEKERERQAADLAELSHRLISVQEAERQRLSAELHDRTSPNLAALDINLRFLARRLPAALDGEASVLLDDATALLADTADSIREVCADLRPPILDYAGLLSALQSYALQFSARTGIAVELDTPGQTMRFGAEAESTLFRIAQEALTNCAKHAGAHKVLIRFEIGDVRVKMEVVDDGVGFAPVGLGEQGGSPGLGLITMRERARFAGGELRVESQPGQGTRLLVVIPTAALQAPTVERRRQATFHSPRGSEPAPAAPASIDSHIEG